MPKTYTTIQGDMWDHIAFKTMGGERYTDLLLAANPLYKDISVFGGGVALVIPEVATPKPSTLPPWKRSKKSTKLFS